MASISGSECGGCTIKGTPAAAAAGQSQSAAPPVRSFCCSFGMEGEAKAEHAVGCAQRQEFRTALGRFQRYAAHDGEPVWITLGRRKHHVVPVTLPGGRHQDGARYAGGIHFLQ